MNFIYKRFPFLKDPIKNPLAIITITIITLILLGFLILSFTTYGESGLGMLNHGYSINEIYSFHNLELQGEYISFKVDETGYLIPGYRKDLVYCFVVLGNGSFELETPTGTVESPFSALYIPLQPKDYLYLRENLILDTVCSTPVIETANMIMNENSTSFFHAKLFNQVRTYPPPSDNLLSIIYTEDYGIVKYIEAKNVLFKPEKGQSVSFKHEQNVPTYPPIRAYNCLGVGIISMTAILLIGAFLITLDVSKENKKSNYVYIDKKIEWAMFATLTLSYFLILTLSKAYNPDIEFFLYPIAAAFSIYIKHRQGYNLYELGLNWDYPYRNIVLGITLGILGFFMGTLRLPSGFHPLKFSAFFLPLLISFSREVIFRSFIQTTAEKHFGRWVALGSTSLLASVPYLLYGLIFAGLGPELWINSLFAIPSVSLISGYIFLKTRSILGGTIFNAVLMILSLILVY